MKYIQSFIIILLMGLTQVQADEVVNPNISYVDIDKTWTMMINTAEPALIAPQDGSIIWIYSLGQPPADFYPLKPWVINAGQTQPFRAGAIIPVWVRSTSKKKTYSVMKNKLN